MLSLELTPSRNQILERHFLCEQLTVISFRAQRQPRSGITSCYFLLSPLVTMLEWQQQPYSGRRPKEECL